MRLYNPSTPIDCRQRRRRRCWHCARPVSRGRRYLRDTMNTTAFLSPLMIAARSLARARGFALAATLTLAIGLGSTVAVFTILNAQLIKPLPYPEADRLMDAWLALP